jgi:hypothetical protein
MAGEAHMALKGTRQLMGSMAQTVTEAPPSGQPC